MFERVSESDIKWMGAFTEYGPHFLSYQKTTLALTVRSVIKSWIKSAVGCILQLRKGMMVKNNDCQSTTYLAL